MVRPPRAFVRTKQNPDPPGFCGHYRSSDGLVEVVRPGSENQDRISPQDDRRRPSHPDQEVDAERGGDVQRVQTQSGRRVREQNRVGELGVHQELGGVVPLLETVLGTEESRGQTTVTMATLPPPGKPTWMFLMKETVTRSSNSFRGVYRFRIFTICRGTHQSVTEGHQSRPGCWFRSTSCSKAGSDLHQTEVVVVLEPSLQFS